MGRSPGRYQGSSSEKNHLLYDIVQQHPGIRLCELQRQLGWTRGAMTCTLGSMDSHGLLLYEDKAARLFVFDLSPVKVV